MSFELQTIRWTPHHQRREWRGQSRAFAARGMSTIELLASIIVISGILGALVVISNSLRTESARRQTLDILRHLRDALQAYHDVHHAYPPGPTTDALTALFADPKAQTYLHALSPRTDGSGYLVIHDGYGHPVHYLAPASLTLRHSRDSVAGGHVDFVSAGADGRIGDIASSDPDNLAAVTDNLYGSDTERAK